MLGCARRSKTRRALSPRCALFLQALCAKKGYWPVTGDSPAAYDVPAVWCYASLSSHLFHARLLDALLFLYRLTVLNVQFTTSRLCTVSPLLSRGNSQQTRRGRALSGMIAARSHPLFPLHGFPRHRPSPATTIASIACSLATRCHRPPSHACQTLASTTLRSCKAASRSVSSLEQLCSTTQWLPIPIFRDAHA